MNNIEPQIRKIRKAKKLTQSELAAASGVAVSTISAYETINYAPNTDTVLLLLDALGYELVISKKGAPA